MMMDDNDDVEGLVFSFYIKDQAPDEEYFAMIIYIKFQSLIYIDY